MTLTLLQKKIIEALKKIPKADRDLKTLTIWLNLNRIHGSDKEYSKKLEKELHTLKEMNFVDFNEKNIWYYKKSHKSKITYKKFRLWTFIYKGILI